MRYRGEGTLAHRAHAESLQGEFCRRSVQSENLRYRAKDSQSGVLVRGIAANRAPRAPSVRRRVLRENGLDDLACESIALRPEDSPSRRSALDPNSAGTRNACCRWSRPPLSRTRWCA
jgi:hypothetical protein